MKYTAYRMHFTTAVHFGRGLLADSESVLHADTVFSALCHEAIAQGGEGLLKEWVTMVREGKVRFSNAMPFIDEELYVPKPLKPVVSGKRGSSMQKKAFKKLLFIPSSKFDAFLDGRLNAEEEAEKLSKLGSRDVRTQVAVRGILEPLPYSLGTFTFSEDSGLYVLVRFMDDEAEELFETLFMALSFTGIGGKTRSGLGKFEFSMLQIPEMLLQRLTSKKSVHVMTLATSLPADDELETAIEEAWYLLEKRSGFIASEKYDAMQRRKKDLYLFRAGSCFMARFEGELFDVTGKGPHPVYRYGYPMFVEVN